MLMTDCGKESSNIHTSDTFGFFLNCSELQGIQSDEKKFLQKCQNWVQFLEKAKEDLKRKVPGTLEKLQEQQKQHEVMFLEYFDQSIP